MVEKEGFAEGLEGRLIEARGAMTQERAAEVAGSSDTSIWRWEHGHRVPSPLTLRGLAAIYGVSYEWLRDGVGVTASQTATVTTFAGPAHNIQIAESFAQYVVGRLGEGKFLRPDDIAALYADLPEADQLVVALLIERLVLIQMGQGGRQSEVDDHQEGSTQ